MSAWSSEWPTTPGFYWIWVGGRVRLCKVVLGGPDKNQPVWVGEARFFYPTESPEAQFMPTTVPEPPQETP